MTFRFAVAIRCLDANGCFDCTTWSAYNLFEHEWAVVQPIATRLDQLSADFPAESMSESLADALEPTKHGCRYGNVLAFRFKTH